mgnify:CR=1 FL=1
MVKESKVIFKSVSFNAEKMSKLSETEFIAQYAHIDQMFNTYGKNKEAFLKEAYKLVKDKYNALSKKEVKEEPKLEQKQSNSKK